MFFRTDPGEAVAVQPMRRALPSLRPAYLLYGGLALLVLGILAFATLQPFQVLPRMGLSPGFALVDQDGQRLTSEDLRGRIVLYNFTYIGCKAPCPQMHETMKAVQDRLAQIETYGLPVHLVSISFDPAHDTPARLRAYAAAVGADTARWHFLSGDDRRLKAIIGSGFGAYYETSETGYTFDPIFVLVDNAGLIRAVYRTATPALAMLQRDIELVASEAQNNRGALHYAYEGAHLFLCSPNRVPNQ